MKVVKADAKGRITGFDPGESFVLEEEARGSYIVTPVDSPGRVIKDVSTSNLFDLLGIDPYTVPAENSIRAGRLPGNLKDREHLNGLYVDTFVTDSEGKRVIDENDNPVRETVIVRLTLDAENKNELH